MNTAPQPPPRRKPRPSMLQQNKKDDDLTTVIRITIPYEEDNKKPSRVRLGSRIENEITTSTPMRRAARKSTLRAKHLTPQQPIKPQIIKKLPNPDIEVTTPKETSKPLPIPPLTSLQPTKSPIPQTLSPLPTKSTEGTFGKLMKMISPRRGPIGDEKPKDGPFSPKPEEKEKPRPKLHILDVTSLIRNVVSKNKKRFQQDGFDLDLSYITPQIVAMGYPSSGFESNYRNPAKEVLRLLESKHKNNWKIYNLCEERQYDPSTFFARVESFGFKDHQAPPLVLMSPICKNITRWLTDKDKVVCLHCKAGKGRTGTIIAAYLLESGKCKTAQEALDFFGVARTKDGKGVTIPSQRRYVHYYERCLKNGFPKVDRVLYLTEIKWSQCPNDGCKPYFKVVLLDKDVFNFSEKVKDLKRFDLENHVGPITFQAGGVSVKGDIYVAFYDLDLKKKKNKPIIAFWINTNMVDDCKVLLRRNELDGKIRKDKKFKNFPVDFAIVVKFDTKPSK